MYESAYACMYARSSVRSWMDHGRERFLRVDIGRGDDVAVAQPDHLQRGEVVTHRFENPGLRHQMT